MEENEYVQKIHELEQELKIRIEDNAELYTKLCNALMQLNDATVIISRFKRITPYAPGGKYLEKDIQEYIKKWGWVK